MSLKDQLMNLLPQMVEAAQIEYNNWVQEDWEALHGGNGICDLISAKLQEVVHTLPDLESQEGGQDGDDHSWLVVWTDSECYGVDIPAYVYETGGGYSRKKKPDIVFLPEHVEIFILEREFFANA